MITSPDGRWWACLTTGSCPSSWACSSPDIAAFAHVADLLKVPAGRVLFLDDNAVNVAGAAAAGFQAARAAGVEEARKRLVEAAVLGTVVSVEFAIPEPATPASPPPYATHAPGRTSGPCERS